MSEEEGKSPLSIEIFNNEASDEQISPIPSPSYGASLKEEDLVEIDDEFDEEVFEVFPSIVNFLSRIVEIIKTENFQYISRKFISKVFFFPPKLESRFEKHSTDVLQFFLLLVVVFLSGAINSLHDIYMFFSNWEWLYLCAFFGVVYFTFLFMIITLILGVIRSPILLKVLINVVVLFFISVSCSYMFRNHWENQEIVFILTLFTLIFQTMSVLNVSILFICCFVFFIVFDNLVKTSNYIFLSEWIQMFFLYVFSVLSVYNFQLLLRKGFISQYLLNLSMKQGEKEFKKNETLFLNILPQHIVVRLKAIKEDMELQEKMNLSLIKSGNEMEIVEIKETIIHEEFSEATIAFVKVWNFHELENRLSAIEMIRLLNETFSIFDNILKKFSGDESLYRIKTISEKYMFTSGLPTKNDQHLKIAMQVCIEMLMAIKKAEIGRKELGLPIHVAIGLNVGNVVAGVVPNVKRPAYDIFGDSVNHTARLASSAPLPGCIHVSEGTYERLKKIDQFRTDNWFQHMRFLKGKGNLKCYYFISALALLKKKNDLSNVKPEDEGRRVFPSGTGEEQSNSKKGGGEEEEKGGEEENKKVVEVNRSNGGSEGSTEKPIAVIKKIRSKIRRKSAMKREASEEMKGGIGNEESEVDEEESGGEDEVTESPRSSFSGRLDIEESRFERVLGMLGEDEDVEEELMLKQFHSSKGEIDVLQNGVDLIGDKTKRSKLSYINPFLLTFRDPRLNSYFFQNSRKRFVSINRRVIFIAVMFYIVFIVFDFMKKIDNEIGYSWFEIFLWRWFLPMPAILITSCLVFLPFYSFAINVISIISVFGIGFAFIFGYYFFSLGFEMETLTFIIQIFVVVNLNGLYFFVKVIMIIVLLF